MFIYYNYKRIHVEEKEDGTDLVFETIRKKNQGDYSCKATVRGQEVEDTGAPIMVPVGPETLGRIMNVIGEPIDERGPIVTKMKLPNTSHTMHCSGC